jgi:predicted ATPase
MDVVPTRLRQPGAVVLEIDEEDPIFEDLEEIAFARTFYDLPQAAGQ